MDATTKQSLARRLEFARIELSDLRQFQCLEYATYNSDRSVRRNVERMIENICNSLTDIGKIILAQYEVEMPETYREVFIKLETVDFINKSLSESLSQMTKLGNVLAHQYLDIKWQYIKAFLQNDYQSAEAFLNHVEQWLGEIS